MTDNLEPCSRCGNEDIIHECDIGPMFSKCYCFCARCGICGRSAPSQEQARAAWNEMQEGDGNDSPKRSVSPIAERGDEND